MAKLLFDVSSRTYDFLFRTVERKANIEASHLLYPLYNACYSYIVREYFIQVVTGLQQDLLAEHPTSLIADFGEGAREAPGLVQPLSTFVGSWDLRKFPTLPNVVILPQKNYPIEAAVPHPNKIAAWLPRGCDLYAIYAQVIDTISTASLLSNFSFNFRALQIIRTAPIEYQATQVCPARRIGSL